jgi:hypothetical protein
VQLKNVQHVLIIGKNLVSGSLLCRDGFKIVMSPINLSCLSVDNLSVKAECGGLFRFSVSDYCSKSVNLISDGINESDASVWHSRLYHLNFGSMFRFSTMSLIPNFSIVKGSKCYSCVQSKQPQKPHKVAEDVSIETLTLIERMALGVGAIFWFISHTM